MTRIHVLGAGTPTPTPLRFGSSTVVEFGGTFVMFDCGPAATDKLVKSGLWPTKIDYLFFTHHHFDHDVDYPCFLLCRWDQSVGTEAELRVFGPPPTRRLTAQLLDRDGGAFSHDWIARMSHPLSQRVYVNRGGVLPRKPPRVHAEDVGPGLVHEGDGWRVSAAPATHVQPFLDSLAYRLDTPDGSVVITGDTEPCQSIVDLAHDADVLLCMCWDDQDRMDANGEALGQCGTKGAARMAADAKVRKLVLTHVGPHLSSKPSTEHGLRQVADIFDGEVVQADELMTIEL